jgi:hypothetical protein
MTAQLTYTVSQIGMHAAECLYPLSGGLMLGSCVYHLLYLNGKVLGISGIYGSAISRAISIVGFNLGRMSTSVRKLATNTPSEGPASHPDGPTAEDPLLANTNSPTSVPKEKEIVIEEEDWKIASTLGLLATGALLRIIRPYLERNLGVPIFDPVLGDESSKSFQLSMFVVGLLIGVGSKVRSVHPSNEVNKVDVAWMYSRPHALWYVTTFTPFNCRNRNILCNCSSGTSPSPRSTTSTNPPPRIQSIDGAASTNPILVLSIHHPATGPYEMVPEHLFIYSGGPFCVGIGACRNAPAIQNPKLPCPSHVSELRPVPRICRNRRTRSEYSCMDNAASICQQTAVCCKVQSPRRPRN